MIAIMTFLARAVLTAQATVLAACAWRDLNRAFACALRSRRWRSAQRAACICATGQMRKRCGIHHEMPGAAHFMLFACCVRKQGHVSYAFWRGDRMD
jgi:hypothetical protein